jgi:hypothetical protein
MTLAPIIAGILLFLVGFLTPVSTLYTLPISLPLIILGITRLLKRENGQARRY